jgi:hypothetical protein
MSMILRARPRDLKGLSFTSGAPGEVSGALGVTVIENQTEMPAGSDGQGGFRLTTYTAAVQVFHRSAEPDAMVAEDHFDAVIDSLCNRLRMDPSLGTPHTGPIISGAHQSLAVEYGEPEQMEPDGGLIATWAVVRFPVEEWNQAT